MSFRRLRLASVSLGELFSGGATYTVPAFQRPFEWGSEEALQLLDDVSRAAGIDAPDQGDPDYFLGTVLLLTEPGHPLPGEPGSEAGVVEYQIIDGQQRLSTATMIFAILRDLAEGGGGSETFARLIERAGAAGDAATPLAPVYRIRLNGPDRDLFQRFVQRAGTTRVESDDTVTELCIASSKILTAREALISALTQFSQEQRDELARFLADSCHVVVTLSHDIERAHRLFTVLNERGKPLRRNDIVKVEVLGGVAPDDSDYVRGGWESAELLLGDQFETFFSHLKAMYGRRRVSVVAGLKTLINQVGGPRAFVDDLLKPYAGIFAYIQECEASPPADESDAVAVRLYHLGRLRGQEWYPAAMAVLKVWRESPETAAVLLRGIDRVALMSRILCHGGGRRATRYNRIVQAVLSKEAKDDTADVFAFKNDDVRNAKFHLRNLHRRNPPVCKLLLMRIEDRLSGQTLKTDPRELSVEHVLPIRPSASGPWRVLYPEPDVREAVTQCLGNYTLIPDKLNDRIRNKDFGEKKRLIREHFAGEALLKIVEDVVDAKSWDLKTVAARERRFLEILSDEIGIDVRDAAMDLGRYAAE